MAAHYYTEPKKTTTYDVSWEAKSVTGGCGIGYRHVRGCIGNRDGRCSGHDCAVLRTDNGESTITQ